MKQLLLFVVTCAVLAIAYSATIQPELSEKLYWNAAPKPCCFPSQYEAKMDFVAHGNFRHHRSFYAGSMMASFDHKNNRTAFRSVAPMKVKIVANFNKPKPTVYVITRNGKRCRTLRLPPCASDHKCLPASMKFAATSVIGSPKKNVKVNTFVQQLSRCFKVYVSATVTTKANGCYPVSHSIAAARLPHHRSVMKIVSFTGVSDGIKDPSVFNLPPSCKKATVEDIQEIDTLVDALITDEDIEETVSEL